MALASGALPVAMLTKPPAWMIRSKAVRSTTRSRSTGKARARHGSMTISSPSRKLRMCSWQVAVPAIGPWATPLIIMPQRAADAFAAVVVERDGLLALFDEPLVHHVQHLQERHVRADVPCLVGHQPALGLRPGLAPDVQGQVHHL